MFNILLRICYILKVKITPNFNLIYIFPLLILHFVNQKYIGFLIIFTSLSKQSLEDSSSSESFDHYLASILSGLICVVFCSLKCVFVVFSVPWSVHIYPLFSVSSLLPCPLDLFLIPL